MGSSCCSDDAEALATLHESQRRVLWIALAINAVLFVVEFTVGWWARSIALLGDSLDMLGDAFVYAFSLWVLHRGRRWRARAAYSKGLVQLVFGLFVLAQAAVIALGDGVPDAGAMGWMGAVALAGNVAAFSLLWRHRSDDVNMRSTWLCSRNDLIANTSVIAAAVAVAALDSRWPDVVVGVAIASLFLRTAHTVITEARSELAVADQERGAAVG